MHCGADPAVTGFNAAKKVRRGFRPRGVAAGHFCQPHAFPFVGGVESIHRGVVVRIAFAAHARRQQGTIFVAGAWHPENATGQHARGLVADTGAPSQGGAG